jgi:hypothetical protein
MNSRFRWVGAYVKPFSGVTYRFDHWHWYSIVKIITMYPDCELIHNQMIIYCDIPHNIVKDITNRLWINAQSMIIWLWGISQYCEVYNYIVNSITILWRIAQYCEGYHKPIVKNITNQLWKISQYCEEWHNIVKDITNQSIVKNSTILWRISHCNIDVINKEDYPLNKILQESW